MRSGCVAVVFATVFAVHGCGSKHVDPVQNTLVPQCQHPQEPVLQGCPSQTCGGNSPAVNTFPVNGVRPHGQCDREGIQLMPGSLQGGGCGQGADLTNDGNVLIGVRDGAEVCRAGDPAHDLVSATFDVRSFNGTTLTITISESRMLTTYTTYRGYKLTVGGTSLCNSTASSDARTALGLAPYPPVGQIGPVDPDVDLIMALDSEMWASNEVPADNLYAEEKAHETLTGQWLQFACVEDALAKRTLFGLDNGTDAKSRAALHMITANYCGTGPYTMRGIKINWTGTDVIGQESAWDANHAICLDKARLLYTTDPPSVPSGPDVPKPPTCPQSGPCTVDQWLAGVRGLCNLHDTCQPNQGVIQSYLPTH